MLHHTNDKTRNQLLSLFTLPTIVVFIDFEKAFELANLVIITDEARRLGIKGNILAFIKQVLSNRSGTVRFQNKISDSYQFQNGNPKDQLYPFFI